MIGRAKAPAEVVREALLDIARGNDPTSVDLVGLGLYSPIHERPRGSQNIPVLAAAVEALSGAGADASRLLPFLTGKGGWLHNGTEGVGLIYPAWNWTAMLMLRRHVDRGSKEVNRALRRWLRAMAARLALGASPTPARHVVYQLGEHIIRRASLVRGDVGAMVHLPAERSATPFLWRRKRSCPWIERSALHDLFRGTLGMSTGRKMPRLHSATARAWPLAAAAWAVGGDFSRETTPAARWGLAGEERRILRRFVNQPKAADARVIVGWLEDYPHHGGVETVIHHAVGGIAAWQSKSTNHVKAGQGTILLSAWHQPSGIAWRVTPTPSADLGRVQAFTRLADEGRVVLMQTSDGPEIVFPLAKLGAPRFRVIHDQEGWRVEA